MAQEEKSELLFSTWNIRTLADLKIIGKKRNIYTIRIGVVSIYTLLDSLAYNTCGYFASADILLLFSSKSIQNILILSAIVAPFASAGIRPVVNRLNQDTTEYYGLVFCLFFWPYMVKWYNSGIISTVNGFTQSHVIPTKQIVQKSFKH